MTENMNTIVRPKSKFVAKNDYDRCVACGACIKECPRESVNVYKGSFAVVDENLCVGCGRCAKVCPSGSIVVKDREAKYE